MFPPQHFGPGGVMFTIVPLFIGLVFVLVIGAIIVSLIKGAAEWSDNNSQPQTTTAATLISKRLQVSGGENSTSTRYFATFELPGAERREFKLSGSEYGQLAEGDAGQLSYQGTRYLGFERVAAKPKPPVAATAPAYQVPASLVCDYCRSAIPAGTFKCPNCGWTWHPATQGHAAS